MTPINGRGLWVDLFKLILGAVCLIVVLWAVQKLFLGCAEKCVPAQTVVHPPAQSSECEEMPYTMKQNLGATK